MIKLKNGFTLVELIVVITILSILWTIAFISIQWYSSISRDSVRLADLSNISKSLEIFYVQSWKYPIPSDYVSVEYQWAEVWKQWKIWESVLTNLKTLDKTPVDPLSNSFYTYSITNKGTEY